MKTLKMHRQHLAAHEPLSLGDLQGLQRQDLAQLQDHGLGQDHQHRAAT